MSDRPESEYCVMSDIPCEGCGEPLAMFRTTGDHPSMVHSEECLQKKWEMKRQREVTQLRWPGTGATCEWVGGGMVTEMFGLPIFIFATAGCVHVRMYGLEEAAYDDSMTLSPCALVQVALDAMYARMCKQHDELGKALGRTAPGSS